MKLGLIKFSLELQKYPKTFNPLFLNSGIKIILL